jgi:hypothetical protein
MNGDQQVPDIRPILDPLKVPNETKAQVWDAWHSAKDDADFQRRFAGLNIPNEAKASLWDMKFAPKDIFDQVAKDSAAVPEGDIFDRVAKKTQAAPAGDVFDKIAPSPLPVVPSSLSPYLRPFGATIPAPPSGSIVAVQNIPAPPSGSIVATGAIPPPPSGSIVENKNVEAAAPEPVRGTHFGAGPNDVGPEVRLGEMVPASAVPALQWANKYLVQPFERLANKGAELGINVRQYRTDAEQKMLEMREPASHKERPQASLMLQYRRDIADGTLDRKKLDADVRDGKLTAKDRTQRKPRLQAGLSEMSLDDALQVWKEMNPDEQKQYRPAMIRKASNEILRYPVMLRPAKRAAVMKVLNEPAHTPLVPRLLPWLRSRSAAAGKPAR